VTSGPRPPEFNLDIRWVAHQDLRLDHRYWTNPRSITGLDDASLLEIGNDIKAGTTSDEQGVYAGVRVAFEVVKVSDGNGGYINLVTDGQRRYRAIDLVGMAGDVLIPVLDLEDEPVDLTPELASKYLMRALKNVGQRAGLSSYELAVNAQRLRDTRNPDTGKDYTLSEIGRAIGRSESWVSKMLTAMAGATAKLLHSWRTGEITDEVFKDTASVKAPDKQAELAGRAVDARKAGDKTGARTLAKESKLIEQRSAAPAASSKRKAEPPRDDKPKAKGDPARVVRGPQGELPHVTPQPASATPTRKPTPFAVLEDFMGMADKHPPTVDYVRGLVDGVKWATGLMDPAKFAKPWHVYLNHVQGTKPQKPPKPAKEKAPKSKGKEKGKTTNKKKR
jgi:hypothetical protein